MLRYLHNLQIIRTLRVALICAFVVRNTQKLRRLSVATEMWLHISVISFCPFYSKDK